MEENQNTTVKFLSKSLLLVFGLGLFIWGVWGVNQRFQMKKLTHQAKTPLEDLLAVDIEALNSESVPETDKVKALKRLGLHRHPIASEAGKNFIDSESEELRKAAYEVLSHLGDKEAVTLLVQGLSDKSLAIRQVVLEGLSKSNNQIEATLALTEHLKTSISEEEKIYTQIALYKNYSEQKDKDQVLKKIFASVSSADRSTSLIAMSAAVDFANQSEELLLNLRKVVENHSDEEVVAAAIYHLGNLNSSWLEENTGKLIFDKRPSIRMATLNTIRVTCPKDLWEVLTKFFENENSPEMIEIAIRTPRHVGGEQVVGFLNKIKKLKKLNASQKKLIEEEVSLANSTRRMSTCQ